MSRETKSQKRAKAPSAPRFVAPQNPKAIFDPILRSLPPPDFENPQAVERHFALLKAHAETGDIAAATYAWDAIRLCMTPRADGSLYELPEWCRAYLARIAGRICGLARGIDPGKSFGEPGHALSTKAATSAVLKAMELADGNRSAFHHRTAREERARRLDVDSVHGALDPSLHDQPRVRHLPPRTRRQAFIGATKTGSGIRDQLARGRDEANHVRASIQHPPRGHGAPTHARKRDPNS